MYSNIEPFSILYLVFHSTMLVRDLVYSPYEIMAVPPIEFIELFNIDGFNYFSHWAVVQQFTKLCEYMLSMATYVQSQIELKDCNHCWFRVPSAHLPHF